MKKVVLICVAIFASLSGIVYFSMKEDSSKKGSELIAEVESPKLVSHQSQAPLTTQRNSDRKKIFKVDEKELESRYIISSDDQLRIVNGIPVRSSWTTRPAEYAWAVKFAGPDEVVLDAGCGISHPLKWKLAQTCQKTWAIDTDDRINNKDSILSETRSDLGEVAYNAIVNNSRLWNRIHLAQEDILALSNDLPKFDRIYCISVIEQIPSSQRKQALTNLSNVLESDGLILVTFPDSRLNPEQFLVDASEVGLVPAGSVNLEKPKDKASSIESHNDVFRCALKKDSNR